MNKEAICFFLAAFAFHGVCSLQHNGQTCSSSGDCDQSVGTQYCYISYVIPSCTYGICLCAAGSFYSGNKCKALGVQGDRCTDGSECAAAKGFACVDYRCQPCQNSKFYVLDGTACVSRIVGRGGSCVGNSDTPTGDRGGLCYTPHRLTCADGICECLFLSGNSGSCSKAFGTKKHGESCSSIGDCVDGNVCYRCPSKSSERICRTIIAGAPSTTAGVLFTFIISIVTSAQLIS